jgi:isoleucyl-tRNA synthetase
MESAKIDLKKTVHLPKTDFSMKANPGQLSPGCSPNGRHRGCADVIRGAAGQARLYPPRRTSLRERQHPPGPRAEQAAEGFHRQGEDHEGYDSPYVPGWDCHGLPIEHKVESELGSKRASMSPVEIRAACRKYAAKYVDLQRKDFIRLGVFGRWSDPYLTMSAEYEAVIAGAFVEFLDKGYVYKGLKPVNWCINDRTALAEAEIEYENHTSPSIWVRFALTSDPAAISPALTGRRVYSLIWTTTPWTIPANLAISFNPNYVYVAAETEGDVYIVAKDLWPRPQKRADGPTST